MTARSPVKDVPVMLITGASGRIARRTAELLAGDRRHLRLMTRTPQRVPSLAHAELVYGDFAEPASLDRAFVGVTTALVVSGSAKPGERALLHRNAFEAAARARVQHVVYLSLQGSSSESKYPFSRDHALGEQYLAATGIPFTVLRNAFYMDMFLNMFDASGVIRGPAKQGRGAFVSREDCACVAAAVLKAPPGGIHDVTGPQALRLADVARASQLLSAGTFATKMSPSKQAANGEADWANPIGEWSCHSAGMKRSRRASWSGPAIRF
jgi:NAD(P)H dehydrogenase (quinone)